MGFDESFFEEMALNTVLGILNGLKKNPLNNPKVTMIIQHIVTDGCEVLGVVPPTFPVTAPPAPAAPAVKK